FSDLQPLSRRRQAGVDGVRPQLLQLLQGSKEGRDRPISLHEVVNDALREGGPTDVGWTTVDMHQRVAAPVCDQIAISRHLDVAWVFAEKWDRGDAASLEREGFAVG